MKSKNAYHHIVNSIHTDWVAYASKAGPKGEMVSCDNILKESWIPYTTQSPQNYSLKKTRRQQQQAEWTVILFLRTKSENWFYLPSSSVHSQPLQSKLKGSEYFLWACPIVQSVRANLTLAPEQRIARRAEQKSFTGHLLLEKLSSSLCFHMPWKQKRLIYINWFNCNLLLNCTAISALHCTVFITSFIS